MIHEDLDKLPLDQWNALIAQRCGWTSCERGCGLPPEHVGPATIQRQSEDGQQRWCESFYKTIPNYTGSLDAMALAEATLQGNAHLSALTDEWLKYRDALARVIGCAWYQSVQLLRTTAQQRARAFLLATEP